MPTANDLEYVMLQATIPDDLKADWATVSGDFEVAAGNEYWTLYHRVRNDVKCVLTDGDRYPHLVTSVG